MASKSKSKSKSNARNANHDRANLAIRNALVDRLWITFDPADVARIRRAIRACEAF